MTPDRPPPPLRLSKGEALALAAPLLLAVAAYARTLRGAFLFDDRSAILESPWLRSVGSALAAFADPIALASGRPLTALTFALNHAVGGEDPVGYHLVNLALHLAAVLLAGLLALRVAELAAAARPRAIALGVAGLFAVHPLQSQAVSYLSQRSEVLASALYAATLLLLLRADAGRGRPAGARAAALATFTLGLTAKPILLTLPAAYLLIRLAAAPGPGAASGRLRPALRAVLPVAAVAVIFAAALAVALRGSSHAGLSVPGTGPWRYLLTEQRALVVYLRLLVWPAGQSADWVLPASPGLADPATLGAAAVILAVVLAAAALLVTGRRREGPAGAPARLAGLGLAWFLVLLSMTSSVIPLADALVEHRVYLASWGIFLAAVAAADALAARAGRPRLAAAAWALAVLVLALALHRRNAVWEGPEALWSDVLARFPESARAWGGLGDALEAQGRPEEAIRHYERAVALSGGNAARRAGLLVNLGVAQMGAGRPGEARRSFEEARHFLRRDDSLVANLAAALGASGDAAGAEAEARRALEMNPAQATAWVVLGNLGLEREDWPAAVAAYDRAIAVDPGRGEAHYGRALALRMQGRDGAACDAFRAALRGRLAPSYRSVAAEELGAGCR